MNARDIPLQLDSPLGLKLKALSAKVKKCPFCASGHLLRYTRDETYECGDKTVTVKQPGEWCDTCEEGILNGADLQATAKEIQLGLELKEEINN